MRVFRTSVIVHDRPCSMLAADGHFMLNYAADCMSLLAYSPYACRSGSSQESGNPAVDDLRERVAELAGINLTDFLEEGKGTGGGGQTQGGKGKTKVGLRTDINSNNFEM